MIKQTLCWSCGKACGGCRWSDHLKPVDGWHARPTSLHANNASTTRNKPIESYIVIECPEFVRDSYMDGMRRKPDEPVKLEEGEQPPKRKLTRLAISVVVVEDGKIIDRFESAMSAAEHFNVSRQFIRDRCHGKFYHYVSGSKQIWYQRDWEKKIDEDALYEV